MSQVVRPSGLLVLRLALAAVALALSVGRPLQAAPLSVADAFKPSPIAALQLSPDGKRLLAFLASREGTGVVVFDIATRRPQQLRAEIPGRPWAARWLGKDLVVVAVGAETHIYEANGKFVRQIEGRFIGTLVPDEQGHERVLVGAHRSEVERVDVRTGRSTSFAFDWPAGDPVRWLADREGVPRVVTTATTDRTSLTHWVRASASAPWQALESQLTLDSRWTPLAISRDGRSLIVASSEGRDTVAVFRYAIEERALKEVLAGHPSEDIGQANLANDGDNDTDEGDIGSIVRVVTLGMRTTLHWFDPRWDSLQKSVDAALPGRVNWISGSFATGTMLVFSVGDVDPGTWHVLDLASMSMKQFDAIKPEIDRRAMRPMQIVRYRSLDGTEIPAYLTLPADGARNSPAVVLVHGGPVVRDRWAWNPEVQMLASRGYAVLQPQFRGSAGFGRKFEIAGYREWGRAMQDDVTAGAQWLAEQGIADSRRMCIYGGSYGGYATLWALVKTPRLFRCGASIAGVSDLGLFLAGDTDIGMRETGRLYLLRNVGNPQDDAARLDEVSPLRHAGAVEVPVLLAHGNLDRRVPIIHSERMLEALKANGKQVEWLLLRGEQHGIAHPENRELFYNALFAFLARNTAAPAPAGDVAAVPAQAPASAPR
jgi:dipeptidyl aminopeptidase/acylaminoacyl peptidase